MLQNDEADAAILLARHLRNYVDLDREDEAALAAAVTAPSRVTNARRELIAEGAPTRAIFLIAAGWACRFKALEDGRRQIVSFLLPGDICDLNNILLARMDHSIGAITAVRHVELPNERVQALSAERPRIGRALWKQMLVTLAVQREWTMNIGQRSAVERIGSLFCELRLRLRSVGLANGAAFDLPLTQTDIAEATGLTSVHVNRTLQQMRADGLVSLTGRVLTILDLDALRDLALFTPDYLHLDEKRRQDADEIVGRSAGT